MKWRTPVPSDPTPSPPSPLFNHPVSSCSSHPPLSSLPSVLEIETHYPPSQLEIETEVAISIDPPPSIYFALRRSPLSPFNNVFQSGTCGKTLRSCTLSYLITGTTSRYLGQKSFKCHNYCSIVNSSQLILQALPDISSKEI